MRDRQARISNEARKFAEAIRKQFPGKLLAYNCSPSFNWKKNLDDATIAKFQRELGAMGYKFQFITLAGIPLDVVQHVRPGAGLRGARHDGLRRKLQEAEFAARERGYTSSRTSAKSARATSTT